MISTRNVGLAILFTILSCGIYGIYWFVKLTDESTELSGIESTSGIMAFIFSILTCGIYSIFWAYNMGKKLSDAQGRNGLHGGDNSALFLILSIFGLQIVVYAIAQSDINRIVESKYIAN